MAHLAHPADGCRDGGIVQHPRGGVARERDAHLIGQTRQLLDDLQPPRRPRRAHVEARCHEGAELALVSCTRLFRRRHALAVATRQPSALEGAPHHRPESVRLTHGKDLALGLARQDRIRRLRRDEALEPAALADPERLHHLPPAERHRAGLDERAGGHAEVADLALPHEVGQCAQGLLEGRVLVVAMDLIQIDPVGAESPKALVDLQEDVAARRATIEDPTRPGHEDLRRDHRLLAPALERLADDLFRLPHPIAVRRVDEGDALVERAADDADAVVVVGIAPPTERHRAETDARDLETAVSESKVLHGRYPARAPSMARRSSRSSGPTLLGKKARTSPSFPTTYLQKFQFGASPPRSRNA